MHQLLLIGASLPLFAVIGWALLSPDQATDDQPEENTNWGDMTRSRPVTLPNICS